MSIDWVRSGSLALTGGPAADAAAVWTLDVSAAAPLHASTHTSRASTVHRRAGRCTRSQSSTSSHTKHAEVAHARPQTQTVPEARKLAGLPSWAAVQVSISGRPADARTERIAAARPGRAAGSEFGRARRGRDRTPGPRRKRNAAVMRVHVSRPRYLF